MARPTKQGIDYFPMDVDFDNKIELFVAETGAEGYGILIMLWQMIYRGNGYFIEDNEDLKLLLRKHTFSTTETIEKVIEVALKRDIFSRKVYDLSTTYQHSINNPGRVLTSHGIQKRFFEAAKKKKVVYVIREILLVPVSDYNNLIYSGENPVSVSGNATKEKVKEKEKVEENPLTPAKKILNGQDKEPHFPTMKEAEAFFLSNNSDREESAKFWHHYNAVGWKAGGTPIQDWRSMAFKWISNSRTRFAHGNARGPDKQEPSFVKLPDFPCPLYTTRQIDGMVHKGNYQHRDFAIVRIEGVSACRSAVKNGKKEVLLALKTDAQTHSLTIRDPICHGQQWPD